MRRLRIVIALLPLLLLAGCCQGNVTPEEVSKAVAALAAAGGALAARRGKVGDLFELYLRHRTFWLFDQNGGWKTEANYASLAARLQAEIDQVAALLASPAVLGTDAAPGALAGGADGKTPQHRDLADAAKKTTTDGPDVIADRTQKFQQLRRERVIQIVWCAAGLESAVWDGPASSTAPVLRDAVMLELLDRRLYAIEYLVLHDEANPIDWALGAVRGPWRDGVRSTVFNYPWVEMDGADLRTEVGAAAWSAGERALFDGDWKAESPSGRRNYKTSSHLPAGATNAWTSPGNYRLRSTGAVSPSQALEVLAPTANPLDARYQDFWERVWIYCDIMLAILHMAALRVGRRRRTGSDAAFDAAVGTMTLDAFGFRIADRPKPSDMIANGDTFFEGQQIDKDQLQPGDHLIFYNHFFSRAVLGSPFNLENSIVTQVLRGGRQASLAGHGMPEGPEATFTESMRSEVAGGFQAVLDEIKKRATLNPALAFFGPPQTEKGYFICRWEPFGEMAEGQLGSTLAGVRGAWWIRVHVQRAATLTGFPLDMAGARIAMPWAVQYDAALHTGEPNLPAADHAADFAESLFLPLQVPVGYSGGWQGYFDYRRANPAADVDPFDLADFVVDGSMVPGFFMRASKKISVLRPRPIA